MLNRMRMALAIVVMLATSTACTTARVAQTVTTKPVGGPPAEILVNVSATVPSDAKKTREIQAVSSTLQANILEKLVAARIAAAPLASGVLRPGAAVLQVTVTEASPGSRLERFVVGFGVGRAELEATANLRVAEPADALPLLEFNTSSDSGFKPGLLLPGGIALATGKVVHLAIAGGVDVALNVRGGLSQPLNRTTQAVVDQLEKYYESVGWYWPATHESQHWRGNDC
jgi:hypothetical protein